MMNITRFNKTIQERFEEATTKAFDLAELLEEVKNDSYGEVLDKKWLKRQLISNFQI